MTKMNARRIIIVSWVLALGIDVIVAFVWLFFGLLEQDWLWMIGTVSAIPLLITLIIGNRKPPRKQLGADEDVIDVSTDKEKQAQIELNVLQTYIDGKLKRLNLLFLVNGGAFAIVELSVGDNSELIPMKALATGAIVFTTVMVCDTWLWAQMMKDRFLGSLGFGYPGKVILFVLGLLITVGWLLLGLSSTT
jgi:hypothetical protein